MALNQSPTQSLLDAKYNRYVDSEKSLRSAIADLLSEVVTGAPFGLTGRRVVQVAPISLSAPITIPSNLPGFNFVSNHLPITCISDNIDAFIVEATLCSFEKMLFFADQGTTAQPLFRRAFTFRNFASFCRVMDCHFMGCDSMVSGEANSNTIMVKGNVVGVTSGRNGDCVTISGRDWQVSGNTLDGSGTGIAVRGVAGSSRAMITSNSMSIDGVNTSASSGENIISANTRTGTVTTHASDKTNGDNSP